MPRAGVGRGVELEYETFGEPGRPAVLLISGLGSQLLGWTDGLCEEIASRGFLVIRFDNRDVGFSTKLPGGPPYTLSDMADDAAGLLDALGIPAAHVAGASMGGMIAQHFALEHPERTLTVTIVMSYVGGADSVQPSAAVVSLLALPPPATREERIEQSVEVTRVTWGPSFDEDRSRARATRAIDRAYYPEGSGRQMEAIAASGSRLARLPGVKAPALIIHGDGDPLIPFANAALLVEAIPGAELHVMKDVGHEMPPQEWPAIADRMALLAGKVATRA